MPLFGNNEAQAVDEAAVAEILDTGLIEAYTNYASKLAPGFETFHKLLAITAINHKLGLKGVEIPRTSSPRLFLLVVAPPRTGKTLSVKIAIRSIFTNLPVEQLATGTPEGLAELLSRSLTPPIIVVDEIGHSLATGYSRIDHFLLRAYDGTAWQHITRNNPIYVPAERMRVSLVGMTTPQALSRAQNVNQYALAGVFARFLMLSGNKTNPPDIIPKRPEFGVAAVRVASRADNNSVVGFEGNDARQTHNAIVEEIADGLNEDLFVFFAGIDEHIVKLATAISLNKENKAISAEAIEEAGRLVKQCVESVVDHVAELAKIGTRVEEIANLADRIYNKVVREGGRAERRIVLRHLHIKAALARDAERLLEDEERLATVQAVRPAFYCIPNTVVKCQECEYRRVCPLGGSTRLS